MPSWTQRRCYTRQYNGKRCLDVELFHLDLPKANVSFLYISFFHSSKSSSRIWPFPPETALDCARTIAETNEITCENRWKNLAYGIATQWTSRLWNGGLSHPANSSYVTVRQSDKIGQCQKPRVMPCVCVCVCVCMHIQVCMKLILTVCLSVNHTKIPVNGRKEWHIPWRNLHGVWLFFSFLFSASCLIYQCNGIVYLCFRANTRVLGS